MTSPRLLTFLAAAVVFAILGIAAYFSDHWLGESNSQGEAAASSEKQDTETAAKAKVLLSDLAIANLGLKSESVLPQTFWKTIQVPGMIVDRPGKSDRGIVAPITGVVTRIHRVPGEPVRPGEPLFTLKVLSDSLHLSQSELYKAAQDVKLAQAQMERLRGAGGAIPEVRLIELDHQITRQQTAVKAYRQELLNRGFSSPQVDGVAEGKFVNEIPAVAPAAADERTGELIAALSGKFSGRFEYEMQELKAELGQQVQAGQLLCLIANHQSLIVEGRAFRDETPLLEKSVKERWPVVVDFQEDAASGWPPLNQTFSIRYLSNTINPVNRTFAFQMPLENESRLVEHEGHTQILWRFRPGQKARIEVRVAKMDDVFVLPTDAVVRDGVDAYVFSQNVNTFERLPVKLLLQTRLRTVVANNGAFVPGSFILQNGAAQLNRIAKTQTNAVPKGYHVHADGSLHKNEDEGK